MSRTTNSLRNAGTAVAGQLVNYLLRFVVRTVFLYTLGKEYLGIPALYANVLTILGISELGLSTAISFSLYEPLARDDRETVRSLMGFFRQAYRWVAAAVLVLGLCLMPALPHLMTEVTDKVNIYHYYLLYLAQSVVSYLFFSYKSVLLTADQRKSTVDTIAYACQILTTLLQMAALLVWRSFLLYTLLQIGGSILQSMTTAWIVDRRYPYLRGKPPALDKETRKTIFSRVYAMFLNKICLAVGTATDNLVISSCISVLAVGLYSNYDLVVQVVQKVVKSMFTAFTSSLGNLYTTERRERSAFTFRCLNLLNNGIIVFCTTCFLTLFQPFIQLWLGESYLLSNFVVLTIALNFATNYLQNVVQIFREACGAFVRGKYRPIFSAVLNLGLSLLLVRRIGIAGVFLGSIISRMVTAWWFDAWIVCRACLGISPARYYGECGLTLALTALCSGAVELIFRSIPISSLAVLIGKGLVCAAICGGVCLLVSFRSPEFAYLKEVSLEQLRRLRKKRPS